MADDHRPFNNKPVSPNLSPENSDEEYDRPQPVENGAFCQDHGHDSTFAMEEHDSSVDRGEMCGLQWLTANKRSFESPKDIDSVPDLRRYYSPEIDRLFDTLNLKWHESIFLYVSGIENAVRMDISLLYNLDLNEYERTGLQVGAKERVSALHIEARLNQRLHHKLTEENRECSVKLDSELQDKVVGVQLDLGVSYLHEIDMEEGGVNFIQYLAAEEKIKSCRNKMNLVMKAKVFTYSKEAL